MAPIYLIVFWDPTSDMVAKIDIRVRNTIFLSFASGKTPHMPFFEGFYFFGKKGDKNVVTFEPIMQFYCPSRFRILKTL